MLSSSEWLLRGAALFLAAIALLLPSSPPAESTAAGTTATWPAPAIEQGATRYVAGESESQGPVALEQRVLGGWRAVATTETAADGTFRVKLPTWWLGSRIYRIRSESGTTASWTARVGARYTPRGRTTQFRYSFAEMTRWNPCTVIGYRINARQATPGAVRDTRAAFARISQATGFRFAYRGSTRGIPTNGTNDWYPADTQIVVAWARPSQSSLLADYPGAAGVGGAVARSGYRNGDGSSTGLITRGMVVLNSRLQQRAGFGSGLTRGDTLLHEIGHTMGLSHAGSTEQMMYAYLTRSRAQLGRGDLHALEARGSKLGCIDTTSRRIAARGAAQVPAVRVAP